MSLQKKINEELAKKQEERNKRESSHKFYPSLLGRCFRCQVFTRAGIVASNPPDDRTLRVFKCGELFHDFVQGFIPDTQIEVPCVTDDYSGRADVVTEDTVYDIKSVHSYSFHYSNKAGYDVRKEKYPNWLQLAYYAWVLQKKKMCLVQISKDDLCINEYVGFTDKWRDKLQAEMDELRWHWGNFLTLKAPPPAKPRAYITVKAPNKECDPYCDFLDYCKGVEHDADRRHITEQPLKNSKK